MPNKVYINEETTLTWTDTGGDYTLDIGNLAADGVQVGDRGDLGASPRSQLYNWRVVIDGFIANPVVGEGVDIYVSTSDGTDEDGEVGTVNATGTVDSLNNLLYLGSAIVQTTNAADRLISSGVVRLVSRYVSPVIHNNTVDVFNATSDNHTFKLTPIPNEIQ